MALNRTSNDFGLLDRGRRAARGGGDSVPRPSVADRRESGRSRERVRQDFRMPADLVSEMERAAKREGVTKTSFVIGAVRLRLARPDLFRTVGETGADEACNSRGGEPSI